MKKGFSLIELLVCIIVISILFAALSPVISKKLKNSGISLSQMNEITTDCEDKFGEYCTLCTKKYCIKCELESTNCADNEYANIKTCACSNCKDWDSECVECDSKGCTKCNNSPMRYVKDGKCEPCPTGHYCDGSVDYAACPGDGYYCDATGIHKCTEKYDSQCRTCNSTQCTGCNSYYYIKNGKCESCEMPYCLSCRSTTVCDVCQGDKVKVNNKCEKSCNNYMTGCGICTSQTSCISCKSGYYYNSSKRCTKCELEKCLACKDGQSASSPMCEKCYSGYYLSNGKCEECTKLDANCAACTTSGCLACNQGYILENGKCSASDNKFNCNDSNFMKIGNLCVTRKNMGDSPVLKIPSNIIMAREGVDYCWADSDKCCYTGQNSSGCNAVNGSYSGCNRTLCNYYAAKEICSNFSYMGKTWRLPTKEEAAEWDKYSANVGDNGLMLCDRNIGYNNATCYFTKNCLGAYDFYYGSGMPFGLWTSTIYNTLITYYCDLVEGKYSCGGLYNNYAISVRCVTELK